MQTEGYAGSQFVWACTEKMAIPDVMGNRRIAGRILDSIVLDVAYSSNLAQGFGDRRAGFVVSNPFF